VDDDRAAFAGLVGAVLQLGHAVRLDGKTFVTVLGDGPVGLLTAQIMAGRNASVRLLGRHEARFSLAERWGVKHRHESEVGRRHDQDIVIDCTGSPSGLALASRLVRPRGTIVIKGPPHADALPEEKLWPADLAPLSDAARAALDAAQESSKAAQQRERDAESSRPAPAAAATAAAAAAPAAPANDAAFGG
jgi:threonine dehydrogenase-like Zn-dependent dehydrogenase